MQEIINIYSSIIYYSLYFVLFLYTPQWYCFAQLIIIIIIIIIIVYNNNYTYYYCFLFVSFKQKLYLIIIIMYCFPIAYMQSKHKLLLFFL